MDNEMMNRTEKFLNEYKRLEEIAVEQYNLPKDGKAVQYLERLPEFKSIKTEIAYCREVRNFLQHNPKVDDSYAIEPSDKMISLLCQTIDKILNFPKAINIAILKENISYKSMDDFVRPTMVIMQEHNYTHIPILQDGIVIGVFSENTLMSYLLDEEIIGVDDDVKFNSLMEYLPIDKHRSESFRFVSRNTSLSDINQIFELALKRQDRVGLIFVTQNGKPQEKLLGIISAWDVAGI